MTITAPIIGNYGQAEQRFREALQQMRHKGDRMGIAHFLGQLSLVAGDCGRYEEALSLARESMSLSLEFKVPLMHTDALYSALHDLGRYEEAEGQIQALL